MESKIVEFGSRFTKKSMSEVDRNFWKRKLRKTEIEIEIEKIYDLKLKSNVIRRKIRTKTQFLTQDSARMDPIPHWIKDSLFMNLKTIIGIQNSILPFFSMKSYFEIVHGRRNWSRSDWKQYIHGIWCLDS